MTIEFRFYDPMWIISQVFAAIALVCFIWGWQIKNKVRMMLLIGVASTALAASAPFLGNHSLAVLFGLAAIRNFVFSYLDRQIEKGKTIERRITYGFAAIFAASTIAASTLFMTIPFLMQYSMAPWLEFFIMITLLGLILGNILKGTLVMRLSFIANRVFNIINHIYFDNFIAVIIASFAIGSNLLFYFRQFIAWHKYRKNPTPAAANPQADNQTAIDSDQVAADSGEVALDTDLLAVADSGSQVAANYNLQDIAGDTQVVATSAESTRASQKQSIKETLAARPTLDPYAKLVKEKRLTRKKDDDKNE